jgi:hypothetical protein
MKHYLALSLFAATLCAEEGMWTFNGFPAAKVKQAYGFAPDQAWLDNVRLSSARIAQGCSSSFVSPQGLVLTNHHCASSCIQQLSTKDNDLMSNGFYAATADAERRCPNLELNQLAEITDVTARFTAATKGKTGEAYDKAQKETSSKIEQECAQGDEKRVCEVVSLYNGGIYNLYRYRRFSDVRLVFAPEFAIAFFGGDPDNFTFPRYDLDLTMFRIYEDNKPVNTPNYLRWSATGAKEGELVFTSGHPGSTDRLETVAGFEKMRGEDYPRRLLMLSEYRGMLGQFQERGEEQKRVSNNDLFGVENSLKAIRGQFEALLKPGFLPEKQKAESELQRRINANPKWRAEYGSAWKDEAAALRQLSATGAASTAYSGLSQSRLFTIARTLVFSAIERPKPDAERMSNYRDSSLPRVRAALLSPAPINRELETEKLAFMLTRMREMLGPDHIAVKTMLGKASPRDVAVRLVKETKLDDPALRKSLYEGGAAAMAANNDPMIQFARLYEPIGRAHNDLIEKQIQPALTAASERIARARFAVFGSSVYPDATFSLRLSFGSVKGYQENGRNINPTTIIGGAFERQTGSDPYRLPDSWMNAKEQLDLTVPFNFVSTNDIIGGNSGSPVINQKAELVGLVFDGNIQSLGGSFGYDPEVNRTVSVHVRAITEVMRKIYKTTRLLEELGVN